MQHKYEYHLDLVNCKKVSIACEFFTAVELDFSS